MDNQKKIQGEHKMPNQTPLNVALVGIKPAGVSKIHQDVISTLAGTSCVYWVAAADQRWNDNAAIQMLLHKEGLFCYRSHRDIIEDLRGWMPLDAVTIATPHFTHVPMAIDFLDAGMHVFLEKPPAVTIQSGDLLCDSAELADRVIATNYMYTASMTAQILRGQLNQGVIGDIQYIVCTGLWMRSDQYYQDPNRSWAGKKMVRDQACLDGCLFNQFPHVLNQAIFFATKDDGVVIPTEVRAELYRGHSPVVLEMEDTVSLKAVVNGIPIFLYCTTCNATENPITLEIYGSKGFASWSFSLDQTKYFIEPEKGPGQIRALDENWEYMCLRNYENFLAAVRGEEPLYWPMEQALATTQVINAAYVSSDGIRQIPEYSLSHPVETGGGESAGQASKGPQRKTIIKGIGDIIEYASKCHLMFSQTDAPAYKREPAAVVDASKLDHFDLSCVK